MFSSVTVGPPLSLFTIKMANIWQIHGALYGAHWRVPTHFILYVSTSIDVSTFELSLIRFYIRSHI